jgi:ParB-like chromosome segregation protein Spo0J
MPVEVVAIDRLKPHPRNYRTHPPDQLAHIVRSIEEHGIYRNIVVARDYTILAGHGVVRALTQMKRTEAPVLRLPIDPDSPQALKLLAGDNEIGHLAEIDDRMFTEILKEIRDLGELLGTGYDDMMLQNLIYVTQPADAIRDDTAWAEAGMPEYANGALALKLIVSFRSEADRERFATEFNLRILKREAATWATWWPWREAQDAASLRFEGAPQ